MVVMILAILSAVAVPSYMNATSRFNADAAARRIKADLEYLRHLARNTSSSKSVVFNPTTHSYAFSGVASLDRPSRVYTVELARVPYSAALVEANCGGDSTITFDGFGTPDSAAVIVVESGGYQRRVALDAGQGKVTLP